MDKDSSRVLAEQALFAGEAWFDPIEASCGAGFAV